MERSRANPGRIQVEGPRCPYCHETVTPADAKRACERCMAWEHAECWGEGGGCVSCGVASFARPAVARPRPPRSPGEVLLSPFDAEEVPSYAAGRPPDELVRPLLGYLAWIVFVVCAGVGALVILAAFLGAWL